MNSLKSGRARTLPSRVLVAVDPSEAARHAIAYAQTIAAPGGKVRLVSVAENPRTLVPTGSLTGDTLYSARVELLRDATDVLGEASDAFAKCDVCVESELIDLSKYGGDVVHALVDATDMWQAELLVVGARQHHGLMRWVEGTVSAPLAKLVRCPVLVIPASYMIKAGHLPKRILFAVDGSRQAMEALNYGVRFATPDTYLRALYVVDRAVRVSDLLPIDVLEDAFVEQGTHALAAAEPILAAASGRTSTALARTARTGDDVAHAIVREASDWRADLVVMGTHGRRGIVRWVLGSVAERVARLAQAPLLLVHAHEA